jgi:hypothetical protein
MQKNLALKNEYDKILKNGFQNVFYTIDMKIDGMSNEATEDGVHLTDLHFLRYANYIIDTFKKYNLIKIVAHKD